MHSQRVRALLLSSLVPLIACSHALCYPDAREPRFSGGYREQRAQASERSAPSERPGRHLRLRVVSFNVRLSVEVDAASRLLVTDPRLARADLILLQEMDEKGSDAIARRLGLDYVYYPAIRHPESDRNFGNAVLSRFPILSDRKLVLPGRGLFGGAIRTATLAEVELGGRRVTVASTHLSTPVELGFGSRRAQLRALFRAVSFAPAIVGGDFNDPALPAVLARWGFAWPTRGIGGTSPMQRSIDHIMTSGLPGASVAVGKVTGFPGISDHAPVYADIILPQMTERARASRQADLRGF